MIITLLSEFTIELKEIEYLIVIKKRTFSQLILPLIRLNIINLS
jgi:hypothetical protein